MIKKREKLDVALKKLLKAIKHRTGCEIIDTLDSCGRVLAEDVIAKLTIPPFDRAAMDGYAVKAEDTFGADESNPAILKVVGEVETGEEPKVRVERGEAVRISTGAMMPEGANAVVMVEYTNENENLEVYKAVAPGENVSKKGEDFTAGKIIMKSGNIVQPFDVGYFLSAGVRKLKVAKKVKVAVASTGNEICDVLSSSEVAKIPDSNRPNIISCLKSIGCEVIDLGIVKDDVKEMHKAFDKALNCDAIVFTGATSAGKKDIMPEVIEDYGDLLVHGIAIKPGMPLAFGIVNGKPVFALPGSPVACLITLKLFVYPAIWKLQNTEVLAYPNEVIKAEVERRIPSNAGTRTFARVRLNKDFKVIPVMTSGSGILSSFSRVHGIVEIPENLEGIEAGEIVEVKLTRHLVKSDLGDKYEEDF